MTLTPLGVEVPAGTDAFDPQGDMVEMAASLAGRIVVPVANKAARTALHAAQGASTDEPLIVFRLDAGRVEYNTTASDADANWVAIGPGSWVDVFRSSTYNAGITATTFTTLPGMEATVTVPAGRRLETDVRFPLVDVPPDAGVQVQMTFNDVPRDGIYLGNPGANQLAIPASLRSDSSTSGVVTVKVRAMKFGTNTPSLTHGGAGDVVFRYRIF